MDNKQDNKVDNKIQLPQVTLVAITGVSIYETVRAMKYSMRGIVYGDVVLLTHKKPWYLPEDIRFQQIEKLDNIDKYNHFCVYDLGDYINTDYALIVHHDGFVVNPDKWTDEFLDYDYVGSPWPLPKDNRFHDSKGNIVRVGNGVGLRSKRIMQYPKKNNLPWKPNEFGNTYEDDYICCRYRNQMEDDGIKFAPFELACRFGREHILLENEDIDPFLFHQWRGINSKYPKFRNIPYKIVKKIVELAKK